MSSAPEPHVSLTAGLCVSLTGLQWEVVCHDRAFCVGSAYLRPQIYGMHARCHLLCKGCVDYSALYSARQNRVGWSLRLVP